MVRDMTTKGILEDQRAQFPSV